jgi:Na+/H+ antiporter NhaB
MNAIVGVAGVTFDEVIDSIRDNVTLNPVGVRDIRAAYQRGTTTVAQVEALGIPIA